MQLSAIGDKSIRNDRVEVKGREGRKGAHVDERTVPGSPSDSVCARDT